MSTYTQILYHIVFSTEGREPVFLAADREALFRYIWGLIHARESRLHRVNATLDHVHILTGLHPTRALADFVKDKVSSSRWIKENRIFHGFLG